MQEYIFTTYNKGLPGIFEREKSKLKRILPFATKIEHFGSTAVPGLKGKGVLDIYALVPADKFELAKKKLEESRTNYTFYNVKEMEGGLKMVFRRQYQYAKKIRKINLHIGTAGIKDFETCVAFRDALRESKNLCREYEAVKLLAIKKTKNLGEDSKENSRIYVEAKNAFIKNYKNI